MLPDYKTYQALEKSNASIRELTARLHGELGSIDMITNMAHSCQYACKHFVTQEFVPPEIYNVYGEKSLYFVDYRVRWTADAIRQYFGVPVTANNWHRKSSGLRYRGFRPPACEVGAALSQHKFGRALDCDVADVPAEQVRKEILSNPDEPAFRYITCIEAGVKWLHFDCRDTNSIDMLIVQP